MSFQLPEDLAQAIKHLAQETDRDADTVVVELLTQALAPATSVSEMTRSTLQQVAILESQVSALAVRLAEVAQVPALDGQTRSQITSLEQAIDAFLLLSSSITFDSLESTASVSEAERHQALSVDMHLAKTLDQIFSAAPDLVFVQDLTGRFAYVNTASARVFGNERNYFLGKTFEDLELPLAVSESLMAQSREVVAKKQPTRGNISIPTVYSSTRDYEYIFSPIRSANGNMRAIVFTARDITDHNSARLALEESEEKYRFLFDAANDSILISHFSSGQILNANWSAARQLGYSRRELLQLNLSHIETSMETARRNTLLYKLEMDGSVIFEHVYRRKDGTEIPVEVSAQVIEYEDCLAIQSFARDITDRKQTEEALHLAHTELEKRAAQLEVSNQDLQHTLEELQAAEERLLVQNEALKLAQHVAQIEQQRYRDLFDFAPDGYIVTDADVAVQEANLAAANLLAMQPEFLVGKPLHLFMHPQDYPAFNLHLYQLQTQPQAQTWELLLRPRQGNPFPAAITMTAVYSAGGELTGFRCIIRDITTLKQAEAEVLALNAELEQRVLARTAELQRTNEELAREIVERQRVEEALRRSEAKLNDVLNSAIAAISSFRVYPNRICEYDYRSIGCEVIWGYTAQELLADKTLWLSRVFQADRETVIMPLFEAITAERTTTVEYRFHHKDGSIRWISSTYASRREASAEYWVVTTVDTDITERKRIEEALRASEEKFASAFRSSPDAITISLYPEGRYIEVNDSFYDLTGYTPEEAIGRQAKDLHLWPDLEERTQFIHMLREHKTVRNFEGNFRTKSGEQRTALKSADLMYLDGQLCALMITKDITERKRLEIALQASEAKLNDILDNATVAVTSFRLFANRDWQCEYFSAGCEHVFGYTAAEFAANQQLWMSRILPHDLESVILPSFDEIFAERAYTVEYRFQHKDGSIRWISKTCTPRRDESENCWFVIWVDTDITERKQLEIALQASEAKLNDILNSAIASIISVRAYTDHTWEAEYCSAGSERVFGFTAQELIADRSLALWLSRIVPEDVETVIKPAMAQIVREGVYTIEYRFHHKDNHLRWISGTFASRRDDAANCWIITGISTDITAHIQAEAALRESESRFRAVFEQAAVGINRADACGRILQANQRYCELVGYTESELLEKTFLDITHPDDVTLDEICSRQLWSGEIPTFSIEKRYIRKNGHIVWVRLSVSLVKDSNGIPQYSMGVVEDISDLRFSQRRVHADGVMAIE